jgi:hypothetical protein
MTGTPLDIAFRDQEASPDDPAHRLRFHERILDAELLLLLDDDSGDHLAPRVFDLADGRFVLAFDRDDRLADFVGEPADFAALSGRRLAALMAGQGIGLAVNLGAPSATLLPADAVAWLAEMAGQGPSETDARPTGYTRPDVPPALLAALGPKLAAMADAIATAHLVEARYPADSRLLLALGGVPESARPAVASAVAEAVRFTGLDDLALDVTFMDTDAPARAALQGVALRLDLTAREARVRAAPGADPDRPPKLR